MTNHRSVEAKAAYKISKALALVIGWDKAKIFHFGVMCREHGKHWHDFDYRDWAVIGPIAHYYNCFPTMRNMLWYVKTTKAVTTAYTPQEAIALAVIRSMK
jgi:hypothetical protein